jgi:hypothetical protein
VLRTDRSGVIGHLQPPLLLRRAGLRSAVLDFHGERRSKSTHVSTTDPDARPFRKAKGHEAKLVYQGHVLMDNGHGLAVEGCVTRTSGYGERAAALEMLGQNRTGSCARPGTAGHVA